MSATPLSALAASLLVALAVLLVACSDDHPARLPNEVTAAIVYNEQADRWHAGAIASGDRPDAFLRVLCLTEPGFPEADAGREHTGINIDAQPGSLDGYSGLRWSWLLDGQRWDGGRWSFDFSTGPPTVVAVDPDVEAAFFRDLRRADAAVLVGQRDGEERLSVRFDLTALFNTPIQFAIDECEQNAIEDHTGDYHSAYAYWIPDSERHSITLTAHNPATGASLLLSCGPTVWTDDDAPTWIRDAKGDVYAAATLTVLRDEGNQSHDQADASTVESAAVSWVAEDGNGGSARWGMNHGSAQPPSAQENLRFIQALRRSEELTVSIEVSDAEPIEMRVNGAALFAKPMGADLDACIREYADLNG